jgi:N-6 DNA Methylase
MNAVEIEEAVSELADQPFDAQEFPFAFLTAFGNKETTVRRLRSASSNSSDVPGGVLQQKNIHIAACATGTVGATLKALRESPKTSSLKARFVLATDGVMLEAEDLTEGETVACDYADFPNHFGFFLALAGITAVKQIRDNAFDIRATGRLNRLYVELLKSNPDWGTSERRHDMNHFMARLIFCFFAESTDIFFSDGLFTATIGQMSERDASNTHEVIGAIFRAVNTRTNERAAWDCPRWADAFPYVNGGLFSGTLDPPRFTRIARSYLIHIGGLDWKKINPDIFGSMIQAVAEDEERGALGMHYTSVPNILKVLNPLFLDDLRARLDEAGDNARMLLNLRKRMSRIRVFDPACGSGNFLVIAYKEMREIEAEVDRRRKEDGRKSDIPLTNFRGIELRDFPAEIARLALIIAEYQCDVLYRGQKEALRDFLPLDAQNWITCGNALRLDWLSVCPPTGTSVKHHADDLFGTPLEQAQIDFENQGGETYICGNPPYSGQSEMSELEKDDLRAVYKNSEIQWKSLDYVLGWFQKALRLCADGKASAAFVATNSICQGQQVAAFWEPYLRSGVKIHFARTSFKWKNLARNNAGVTVVVVGLSFERSIVRLYEESNAEAPIERRAEFIGPYLVPNSATIVRKSSVPLNGLPPMDYGSKPADGGGLLIKTDDLRLIEPDARVFVKPYLGSDEYIDGKLRFCIWLDASQVEEAERFSFIRQRLGAVREFRRNSTKMKTKDQAATPFAFAEIRHGKGKNQEVPLETV